MINSLLRIAGVYKTYEKYLIQQIKYGPMPQHIGIILDGNRRWATEKDLNSTDGHWAGAKVGEEVLDWCLEYGIKTLTLYTLSTKGIFLGSRLTRILFTSIFTLLIYRIRTLISSYALLARSV